MVIESILNPFQAAKKPWEMFFVGILYSSVSVLLSLMIFGEESSLVVVFLTVLACVPIIYAAIKLEENKDMTINDEKTLLKEHSKTLAFFMFLFFGIVISLSFWYIFLPYDVTASVFAIQTKTITSINSKITGNYFESVSLFAQIFLNNFKVMVFCLLFAFIYGVGAIFILVWNASVLATAIGNFVRTSITTIAHSTGKVSLANYFQAVSLGVLKYSIHGIPEILSYFIAGLAGGIISIAIIRHDFRSKKFYRVILDSTNLIAISIGILFIAAILEIYVTPIFF